MRMWWAAVAVVVTAVAGGLVAAVPAQAADSLLSRGKPVVASSTENSSYAAGYAVDGNTTTRWASVSLVDPQWIYVDLGRAARVSRVLLNWERAHAVAYRIETSLDGTTWTTAWSTSTGDGGMDDLTGLAATGRYVRMYGTQRGCTGCSQNWGYSLWEFEVYGSYLEPVKGGYYLKAGADITPDTVGQGMNLRSMTTYRSLYDRNVFPGWNAQWINSLMTNYGVEPNFVVELKQYGGPAGTSITCNGRTYSIPTGNMTAGFTGTGVLYYGYDQVTSGALDGLLCNAVNQLNALPAGPVNIQFASERDTTHQQGITQGGVNYTWAQADAMAIPAIQYMIHYFRTNTTRVPKPTFTAGIGGWDHASFVRSYVGGVDGVDYVQYNAYNHSSPSRTPYDVFNRTYSWLPELPAESANRQVIVAEWGTNYTFTSPTQAEWIRQVPAAIAQFPRIRMTNYFNSDADWGTLSPKQDGLDALRYAYSQVPYAPLS